MFTHSVIALGSMLCPATEFFLPRKNSYLEWYIDRPGVSCNKHDPQNLKVLEALKRKIHVGDSFIDLFTIVDSVIS